MKDAEDFLVAEYETLKEFRKSQVDQAQNRFNLFLVLVSSAVGIIALVTDAQDTRATSAFFISVALTSLALLYLGIVTFRRIIQNHIHTTTYTRGLNRIRRYFVERYPEIEQYLTFPTREDYPRFKAMGSLTIAATGLTGMVIFLNAVLAGVGLNCLLWVLLPFLRLQYPVVILLTSIATLAATIALESRYLNREIEKANLKAEEDKGQTENRS